MSKSIDNQKDAPKSVLVTAKRLFGQLNNQRVRLFGVAVCIIFYTILNVFTPYYSAGVIDNLLTTITDCVSNGTSFSRASLKTSVQRPQKAV